jgi:chromosomal replication initiation ATPase DnaA
MTVLDPSNPWEVALAQMKARVSINTYTTWFSPTRFLRAQEGTLHVLVPSMVFVEVLTRTYGEVVKTCLPKECRRVAYEVGADYPLPFAVRDRTAPGLLLIRRAEELEEIARQLRNLAERVYP